MLMIPTLPVKAEYTAMLRIMNKFMNAEQCNGRNVVHYLGCFLQGGSKRMAPLESDCKESLDLYF